MKPYNRQYLTFNDPVIEYLKSCGVKEIQKIDILFTRMEYISKTFGRIELLIPRKHLLGYVIFIEIEKNIDKIESKFVNLKHNTYNFTSSALHSKKGYNLFKEHFDRILEHE